MTSPFQAVLLVDDDPATNYYHRLMLEEWGMANNIYEATNGAVALEFLKTNRIFAAQRPSLILLDINMPVMNGFEFLEKYKELDESSKASFVVMMLTSSLHDRDVERANAFSDLKRYFSKPLTLEQMNEAILELGIRR